MSASILRSLSNDILVSRLQALVRRERRDTIAILHHLGEVDSRGLHLKLGYQSLFVYCTKGLGYSESAAGRRIAAARCMRRFPRVGRLLESREVNLSTVATVAGIALSQNRPDLFERIRGRTKQEVAVIVAEFRPQGPPRDRVRVVCVKPKEKAAGAFEMNLPAARATTAAAEVPEPAPAGTRPAEPAHREDPPVFRASDTAGAVETATAARHSRSGSAKAAPSSPAPAGETRYVVKFAAAGELMRSLEEVRALLSHRLPARAGMEALLAVLCEEFIERHSPSRRRARREKKRAQHAAKQQCDQKGRRETPGAGDSEICEEKSQDDCVAKRSPYRSPMRGAFRRRCATR